MTDAFVRALEEIWKSLPTELGSAWRDLESDLTTLLDEYRNAATEAARARFAQQIEGLILQRAHALWVRLDRAAHATDSGARRPTRGWGDGTLGWPTTLGDPPPSVNPGDLLTVRGADDGRVTRYTDISCPRFVSLQTPRVHVIVRLSELPNPDDPGGVPLSMWRDKRVQVLLAAPGFDILNLDQQELNPSKPLDTAIFDLKPRNTGVTHVHVTFMQGDARLGSVSVPVEILAGTVADEGATWRGPTVTVGDSGLRPDLLLMVESDVADGKGFLRYRLVARGGVPLTFTRQEVPAGLSTEIRALYEHLESYTRHNDPAYRGQTKVPSPVVPAQDIDRKVRNLGEELWRRLLPRDFKAFYAQERARWAADPPSLLIVSDDADIPWELVCPTFPDAAADVPWCERFRLARWLTKADLDPQFSLPPERLRIRDFAQVIPGDLNIAEIEEERRFLTALSPAYGLRATGPKTAAWDALTTWLEQDGDDDGCDWLHLTAHGGFSPDVPMLDSSLGLEGGGRFRPSDIAGSAERNIRRRRPGWVFNSCQAGRCTEGLSHSAGWAGRLIEAGAGVFIAPAWALRTTTAAAFTQALYPLLLKGESLAGAVRKARLAARQAGDPSWLGYTLYGHPEARVELSARASTNTAE